MQFRKKPVVIAAILFDGTLASLEAFAIPEVSQDLGSKTAQIPTLEGVMTAQPGDWIIKGVKGEFYPCKPDIFAATYEPAPDAAPVHDSDCSLHNEPAMPAGPCDCSVSVMSFGQALEALKRGQSVGRTGWNGKGMWIGLHEETGTFVRESCGTELQYGDYIVMKTADNKLVPWVASQTDLLAEDWQIVE